MASKTTDAAKQLTYLAGSLKAVGHPVVGPD